MVIFAIFSSERPIDFHGKTLDVLVKNLTFFYVKNTLNDFEMIAPLRILYPFIKSFVNPFVDIL